MQHVRRLAFTCAAWAACATPPATSETDTSVDGTSALSSTGGSTTEGSPTSDSGTTSDSGATGNIVGCGDGVAAAGERCFSQRVLDTLQGANYVALGDLDGDGHLDIVSSERVPTPPPDPAALVPSGTPPHLERRAPASPYQSDVVSILRTARGDGRGNFTPVAALDLTYGSMDKPLVGDFTGDARLDVLLDRHGDALHLFAGAGGGELAPPVEIALPLSAWNFELGDFDDDGDLDVVGVGNSGIPVLLGDGAGGFTSSAFDVGGHTRSHLLPFDLDGDGALDLLVGDMYGIIETFFGAGDGTFAAGQQVMSSGSVYDLGVLPAQDGRLTVIANFSDCGFKLRYFTVQDGGVLAEPQQIEGNRQARFVLGRFDGDDRDDIALWGHKGIDVILGQEPWPSPPAPLLVGALLGASDLVRGDINGDGVDDILLGTVSVDNWLLLSNP